MPREQAPAPKTNVLALIAIAAAVILGIAFFMTRSNAAGERETAEKTIAGLSNDVAQARATIDETRKVVASMSSTLTTRGEELTAASNQLATVSAELTNAQASVKLVTENLNKIVADAKAYSDTALDEIKKRDQSIKALLDERGEFEKRLLTVNSNYTQFNERIATLQTQVSDAEKTVVAKNGEIERLNTVRVYLQNRLNDPAALREQLELVKSQPAKRTNGSLLDSANLNLELLPSGDVRVIGHKK